MQYVKSSHLSVQCYCARKATIVRGVRNPMKMSDIGFLKTEPNRRQNSKTEYSVSAVRFSKTDFGGLGTVFHVSFTVHLAA